MKHIIAKWGMCPKIPNRQKKNTLKSFEEVNQLSGRDNFMPQTNV
jgi:hypothetical protein